jgi:F-type H+-transporting ATPase subunit delta
VNPIYVREQRRGIVAKLAASMQLDEELANVLYLLGDRNRLAHLDGIVDAFRRLADEKLGRVRAKLTSAVPLDAGAEERIAAKLAQATQRRVILASEIDPSLLGGVVAQVGALTFDGSVRTQLEALRQQLKQ